MQRPLKLHHGTDPSPSMAASTPPASGCRRCAARGGTVKFQKRMHPNGLAMRGNEIFRVCIICGRDLQKKHLSAALPDCTSR